MIKVKKVLKVKPTKDDWYNRRKCNAKVTRTLEWIREKLNIEVHIRKGFGKTSSTIIVWFHFEDPAHATWFEIMFNEDMVDETYEKMD